MSDFYLRLPLSPEPLRATLPKQSMERALIGAEYWHVDASRIPANLPYRARIFGYVNKIVECERRGVGVYLYGPLGSGKTACGVILLKAAMIRGATALMMTSTEIQRGLTGRVEPTLPNGAPLEDGLRNVQFLLIDELFGEDQTTDWKRPVMEMIIRARQRDRLPTIITSNKAPTDVAAGWLKSFMGYHLFPVAVEGHNWRTSCPQT
jgi:hypothetical protein